MDWWCSTCGAVDLDVHGRCACCGSDNVAPVGTVKVIVGRVERPREKTGIERYYEV